MISDKAIKRQFVIEALQRGSDEIRKKQSEIIEENLNKKTGMLSADIKSTSGSKIVAGIGAWRITVSFLRYLRFLDIKSNSKSNTKKQYIDIVTNYDKRYKQIQLRRNLTLYNRVVFAVLYQKTQPEIKYGYTEEIKEKITKQLESAGFKK